MQEEKKQLFRAFLPGVILASIMWLIKILEVVLGQDWGKYGLYPKEIFGVKGIITMPFLHGDFSHLMANTVPLIVLWGFIHINYQDVARKIVIWTILTTGLWTWSFARPNFHIGASGLVYGLISFVLVSGFLRRDRASLALSLLVVFLYGGFIWGMIPQEGNNVSWEAHLSGGIAGLVFAFAFHKYEPKLDDSLEEELPTPTPTGNVSTSQSFIFFSQPTSSDNPQAITPEFNLNYIYYEKKDETKSPDIDHRSHLAS